MAKLVHESIFAAAAATPAAPALCHRGRDVCYAELASTVQGFASGLRALGARAREPVAVWLPAGVDAVAALFGASCAGCCMVVCGPEESPQAALRLLRDTGARVLVTNARRLAAMGDQLAACVQLHTVVLCGDGGAERDWLRVVSWNDCVVKSPSFASAHAVDADLAAVLWATNSGASPVQVALSHSQLLDAAESARHHLGLAPCDRILAALPLFFDHGLNQLNMAFGAGATAVLVDASEPRELVSTVARERITGMAGTASMWQELAACSWKNAHQTLRYVASVGGQAGRPTLDALRRALPATRVYLMYSFTDAVRSTCLVPGLHADEARARGGWRSGWYGGDGILVGGMRDSGWPPTAPAKLSAVPHAGHGRPAGAEPTLPFAEASR
jgi:acyl-CoA synthetase (AMP-forming)/AMP-acid ligase II